MTACSIFVGSLDNFSWEGNWNGNLPKRISPDFPPWEGSYIAPLHAWADKTGVFFQQTDFDGWVARATKAQILDFIDFCYGSDPSYTDPARMLVWEGKAYLVERLNVLKEEIMALDDDTLYGLAGACF